MRLFRSEGDVPEDGSVVSVIRLQELARRWYGDRMEPGWRPRSRDESQAILDVVGLTGDFWRLS
jgi:hypothetical protein